MEKEKKQIYKKWWFWLIIILLIFIIGSGANTNNTSTNNVTNNASINETNTNTNISEETPTKENENKTNTPTDMELMSYAQLVLDDNLNNPKYSRSTSDYKFIQTNLRYKIEGNIEVNSISNKFYMIIEFTDETYKNYDLISLQVGNETIYKK